MSKFSIIALAFVAFLLTPASVRAQNAYVTNAGDNTVSVIDTATNTVVGSPIHLSSEFGSAGVAATPDGSKVYVAASFNVSVIDTATNKVIRSIPVEGLASDVAITPDGRKVYVTLSITRVGFIPEPDSAVAVIDTETHTVVGYITVRERPAGVVVTPDGSKVYVANMLSQTVSVIDTATNTVIRSIPVLGTLDRFGRSFGSWPFSLAVTPDGSKVYVGDVLITGSLSVIDTVTDKVVGLLSTKNGLLFGPMGLAVTPDGSKLYAVGRLFPSNGGPASGAISVIDTATFMVVPTNFPLQNYPFGVAVTPDGSKVYIANQGSLEYPGHIVEVIDTGTNTAFHSQIMVGLRPTAIGIAPVPRRVQ